jgi:hypothetical protein
VTSLFQALKFQQICLKISEVSFDVSHFIFEPSRPLTESIFIKCNTRHKTFAAQVACEGLA